MSAEFTQSMAVETDGRAIAHNWQMRARQVGAMATMAGVAFIGGFIGGDMAPTSVQLGPHDSTVELTVENQTTLDLGPIGNVSVDSPLPVGGIKITVKEIPDGDGVPLGADEIRQYEQFFSAPGRKTLTNAVEEALLQRGLETGGIAAGGALLAYWLLGTRGRGATKEVLTSRRVSLTAALAASALLIAGSAQTGAHPAQPENAVLASVGVHGVNVQGKVLETLINTYGPRAIRYVHELDAYYGQIHTNFFDAYKAKQAAEKDNPTELTKRLQDGTAESVLWISDNHCNTETAGLAADVAKYIHAALVMDSGDQTMGGTAAERLCVAILPQKLGGKIPIVVSLGNHDSPATAQMDKDLGYVILGGKVTKVKGYSFVGDSDVMRSAFNVPIHQEGPENITGLSRRIADVACGASGVDIVMVHEPEEGTDAARDNCAAFVASGHTHVVAGPDSYTSPNGTKVTYKMVNGTTGGAAPGAMTFESKLGKDATMIELVFDKQTKEPLGYRLLVAHPDKSVSIGDVIPFIGQPAPGSAPAPSATSSPVPSGR